MRPDGSEVLRLGQIGPVEHDVHSPGPAGRQPLGREAELRIREGLTGVQSQQEQIAAEEPVDQPPIGGAEVRVCQARGVEQLQVFAPVGVDA